MDEIINTSKAGTTAETTIRVVEVLASSFIGSEPPRVNSLVPLSGDTVLLLLLLVDSLVATFYMISKKRFKHLPSVILKFIWLLINSVCQVLELSYFYVIKCWNNNKRFIIYIKLKDNIFVQFIMNKIKKCIIIHSFDNHLKDWI